MQVKASAFGFLNEDSVHDETYSNYRLATPSVHAGKGNNELRGGSIGASALQ
jgi:hypothetical protein